MTVDATFLLRLDPGPGDGPTVAIKDLIDVAGTPTTAACGPVAAIAEPAIRDAECVRLIRANGGRIIGKTNLHEIAFGGTGINAYAGTPVNPLDPARMPGGSSSGSAVAVATGAADVAIGTDTTGSVRTPAACCGVVGLKTTYGAISVDGVRPLAPSLDTVGPMAATVSGIVVGMRLLDPAFSPATPAGTLGRFPVPGTEPGIEAAIDAAITTAGLGLVPCALDGWPEADRAGSTVAFAEAAAANGWLLADHADELGDETRERLIFGAALGADEVDAARAAGARWRDELSRALDRHSVIAATAILAEPPRLEDAAGFDTRRPHAAVSLAGNPAIVIPVPRTGHIPTSLQLIGRHDAEDVLVATAAVIEAAVNRPRSHGV